MVTPETKGSLEFELFDHTADMGVRAFGDELPSVFENTAHGMFAIIFFESSPKIEPKGEYQIKLQASDLEQLLIDWLNELLYLFTTEHIVFSNFKINIDAHLFTLDAIVGGEIVSDENLLKTREIKAVTYHMLSIKKTTRWEAQVVFDI